VDGASRGVAGMRFPITATTVFLALTRLSLLTAFAMAGFNKIGSIGRTREAMAQFGVPKRLLRIVAVLLPLAELAVALGSRSA
jgi:uncharacterized membrane protein YphA (DoxX/SURF4 family)